MEIASLIISAVSAISSLLIALIVYRFTKNQAKLQLTQAIRSAFMAIDQVAIGDKKSLAIQSEIFFGKFVDEEDVSLRRWHALLALNPIVSSWQLGQLDSSKLETLHAAEKILENMLRSSVVRQLVLEEEIYEKGFVERCREIHKKTLRSE